MSVVIGSIILVSWIMWGFFWAISNGVERFTDYKAISIIIGGPFWWMLYNRKIWACF